MALTVGELTGYADLDDSAFDTGVQRVGRTMETLADNVERVGVQAGEAAGEGLSEGLASESEQGAERASSRIGSALKGVAVAAAAAGVAAGAALIGGAMEAMDQQKIAGRLGAQLGATPALAERYGHIAGQMYAGAVTEDVQGAADAVRATMSSGLVPPAATNAQIESIATKVHDLADTFELDLGQSANAAGQMIKTGLAKDGAEALDVMTRGMQVMGPRADDLADTFNEYSTIFRQLGLSATQATGLLSQGMAAGARDTDVVADSLKEFTLIAQGGGDAVNAAFKAIGLNGSVMQKTFVQGGPQAATALDTVLDRLRGMKDPVERNSTALTLFGTKSEDMQKALLGLDPSTAVAALGQVTGAADGMGNSLRDNAATKLESFKRSAEQAFVNMVGGKVLPVITQAADYLSANLGPALTSVAGHLQDTFGPALQLVAGWAKDLLVPALEKVGGWLLDKLIPAASSAAAWLEEHLAPDMASVGRVVRDDVVPALTDSARWLDDNKTAIAVVAGVITTLLLPVLITTAVSYAQTGIAATVSRGQQVAAWITTGTTAVGYGALQVAASYRTVAGWVASGASAVAGAAQQVGAWVASGAAAVASGARQAATWVVTAAGAVAGAATQVGAAAVVVGGWVLMGVQSLVQAARMAAAWLIAMGPVGWVITAVVALVALIIANWETVKEVTIGLWTATVEWIKSAAGSVLDWLRSNWPLLLAILTGPIGMAVLLIVRYWDQITDGFKSAYRAVVGVGQDIALWVAQLPGRILNAISGLGSSLYNSAKDAFMEFMTAQALIAGQAIEYVKGLPGKLVAAIGDLGSLLYSAGGDVVRGLWNGISSMGSWLKDKLVSFASSAIPGPIKSALGISSPSRVMASQVGRWIPAGIIQGIQSGAGALDRTMASLVSAPPVPALAMAGAGTGAAGWAGGGGTFASPSAGAGLHIEHYHESPAGSARATAEELMWMTKGQG